MEASCQTYSSESDTLREVMVTSARHGTPAISSTVPITSISGSDIQTFGYEGIADAMRMLAGAVVKDYGGIGGMKTVSVRNIGAQHTAVSYDGIVVSNTQAGQIDIGRFQSDNIELLQMAIGQGSDLMQSARHYASAGVVYIETEKPKFGENSYRIKVGLKAGSWGNAESSLRYWQKLGNKTSLSLDASYMRADGAYPFTLRNGTVSTREKRYNSDIWQYNFEANLHHEFRDSSRLGVKAYYYKSERGLPGVVILYNNSNTERLWDENLFVQSSYRKDLSANLSLAVRAKYCHSWNKYEDYGVKYTNGVLTDLNTQNEYYVSSTLGWKLSGWMEMAIAEDLALNTLKTNVNGSPNPKRLTNLTALSAKISLDRVSADANLVATFATESLTESETYSISTPNDRKKLSPSLAISYRLLPREPFFIRAMIKSTFRMPTFNDLYYLHIGNTSLSPEKATEYGLGLTWGGLSCGILRNISLTADAYYDNVRDKIVAFPSTYVWKMANFGKVDIYGLDVTLAANFALSDNIVGLGMSATVTWQDARDKTDKNSSTYNSQLPYTPKWSGGVSAKLTTKWFDVGYTLTGQGERYSSSLNSAEYRLGAYTVHDLSLSKTINFRKNRSLSIVATIHNIADRQYDIIRYYPMHGRSFNIGTSILI